MHGHHRSFGNFLIINIHVLEDRARSLSKAVGRCETVTYYISEVIINVYPPITDYLSVYNGYDTRWVGPIRYWESVNSLLPEMIMIILEASYN